MPYNPNFHHRRSIRLQSYDYTRRGAYFVTICTHERACLFSTIEDGLVTLTDVGEVVAACWQWLVEQYAYVELDDSVIMPNHLHGLLLIQDDDPTQKRKPLGQLMGAFKARSTRAINNAQQTEGVPIWQRNFYEHVVRDEQDLDRIRQYILSNPAKWAEDQENPAVAGG